MGRDGSGSEGLARWLDSLIEAGWLLAALLTPLVVNLWAAQPFEPIKVALVRTLAWAMAALWLAHALLTRRGLRGSERHPLVWPTLAVIAVQILSTLVAVDRGLSFRGSYDRAQGWLTLTSYAVLFLVTADRLRTFEQARRLTLALVLPAVPLVALALAQALGWQPMGLVTDARSPVFATLGRANFLGAVLAMLMPLTLGLGLSWGARAVSGEPADAELPDPVNSRMMAGMALCAAEGAILALTRARAAWLAAGVALLVFGLFWLREWLDVRRWKWIAVGAALGLAGVLALALAFVESTSGAARVTIWRAVLRLIAERPLLGWGPDALGLVFSRVYPPALVYTQGRGVLVDRAHSLLLDWAATTGIAGMLAQGVLLGTFFVVGIRGLRYLTDPRHRALLAGCLAAVAGNAVGTLVSFDVTATATATALCMAVVVSLTRRNAVVHDCGGDDAELERYRFRATRSRFRATRPRFRATRSERGGTRWGVGVVPVVALDAALCAALGAAIWQANVRPVLADVAALTSDRRAAVGDWAGAAGAAERAVALAPWEPAHLRRASWAWLQWVVQAGGEPDAGLVRAEAALLAAREVRPADVATWMALGELYGVWGNRWDPERLAQAHAAYARATELAPHVAMVATAWGMVDWEGGRFAEAAAQFRRAVELDATDGYAFMRLGEAALAQGHVAEASAAFEQAAHWEPEMVPAHVVLARSLWLLGRRAEAGEALARALALDPGNEATLALRNEMLSSP